MVVKQQSTDSVSYHQLYCLATWSERVAMLVACLLASTSGLVMAWVIAQYGEFSSLMVDRSVGVGSSTPVKILKFFGGGRLLTNATWEENREALSEDCAAHGIGLALQFIAGTACAGLAASIMNVTAMKQVVRLRMKFFQSLLRQDMSWYDTQKTLSLASTLNDDMQKIKEGISEKVAMCVFLISTGIISVAVALSYGWELTLASATILPFSIYSAVWVSKYQTKSGSEEQESYSAAGRLVEETVAGVRTVVAFGGEQNQIDRYSKFLEPAEKSGRRRGYITGIGNGINWFLTYTMASICFFYGMRLILRDQELPYEERTYFPGTMMTVLSSVFMASQNISVFTTHTEAFAAACGAAKFVFRLCETEPKVDTLGEAGDKPKILTGEVKLDNVHFSYPARPDVKVLIGLNLHIKQGETVALVGPSGCGKSTVLQLIQRMYDPHTGSVCVSNMNVKNLNLNWLRSKIGVVGQEPVLFTGTIRENIALGKSEATFKEIKGAAMLAYAHDFITSLPKGYDTMIGERGAQLSGGQKQRIALARSIIRDPPLLLLDEATSALDPHSEKQVQAALDKACAGRTTVVVSHRLSTIVNSTRIICMDQGNIIEEGTHSELIQKNGYYSKLTRTGKEFPESESLLGVPDEKNHVDSTDILNNNHPPFVRRQSSRVVSRNSSLKINEKHRLSILSLAASTGAEPYNLVNENTEKEEDIEPASSWEILRLNGPEWPMILVGTIASMVQGATFPIFGLIFSGIFSVMSDLKSADTIARSDVYSGMFLVVAAAAGVSMFLQSALFTNAGIKLTSRLRIQAFSSYLKSEIGFFDDARNSVGVLCARLSGDAASVQAGTGARVGLMLQSFAAITIGTCVAFVLSWRMALVGIAFMPVVAGIVYFESQLAGSSSDKENEEMENATKVATEAIMAIKTVQSMAIENIFMEKYRKALEDAEKATAKAIRWRGLMYGLGQFLPTASYNVTFLYGAVLVAQEIMTYNLAYLVSQNMIVGAWALSQALMYTHNFKKAAKSAARILNVIRRKPHIQTEDGVKEESTWKTSGAFEMKNVEFHYPTRPDQPVLRGIDLKVEKGMTVALVGHSGCGKSTCLQLMQRFYDATTGIIELDGRSIRRSLALPDLRRQLGVVQQEPTLFERSVAENIAFGDNTRPVPMHEIIEAAKAANIHGFIAGLPQGYDTMLGSNGAQISGGQKQRICIARALLRSPRLLLLDEATSALDAQSQTMVADALERASKGRTCVTIAHRLSTIKKADLICVLDKGAIVERGTHEELLALDGHYRRMHRMQDSGVAISPRSIE